MNAITQILLGGAALCALATAPALAEDAPHFGVMALHGSHAVKKTRVHTPDTQHLTYTPGIFTHFPFDKVYRKQVIVGVIANNALGCGGKFKAPPKKTTYGKTEVYSESVSTGSCASSNAIYNAVTYTLTDPNGEGKTDSLVYGMTNKFERNGMKYKVTLKVDVTIAIGK